MRQEYTKKRKNQHIKLSERIKIEVGLATKQSIRSIAKQLRRSVSSISVEIKKGWYKGKYTALIADKRAIARAQNSHKHCKFGMHLLMPRCSFSNFNLHFILQLHKHKIIFLYFSLFFKTLSLQIAKISAYSTPAIWQINLKSLSFEKKSIASPLSLNFFFECPRLKKASFAANFKTARNKQQIR